jgi:hypothetical protein
MRLANIKYNNMQAGILKELDTTDKHQAYFS